MARPTEINTVLLDASSLIGIIQGDSEMACLQPLLAAIGAGTIRLIESTAIITEVLPAHLSDSPDASRARKAILSLLESESVRLVDVSTVVARRAADLRSRYGLRTWDAIHLATAVIAQADVLIVRDGKFPYDTVVDGVWVTKPFDIDEDKLFP